MRPIKVKVTLESLLWVHRILMRRGYEHLHVFGEDQSGRGNGYSYRYTWQDLNIYTHMDYTDFVQLTNEKY